MVLTTFTFLLFCVIVLTTYFIVPKKFQWIILTISSLFFLFYKNFNIETLCQATIVLFTAYCTGIAIEKYEDKKKYLLTGIIVIIGLLIYLKYTNMFLKPLNYLLNICNINYSFNLVERTSLIGISYYSLIMVSYIIDVYRETCKPEKNILKLSLFMSYFPILTSGPFIRYNDIKDDLYGKHKFNFDRMCSGFVRILWGIFKVLVISQRLGYFVDTVYANPYTFNGVYIFLAACFFTLQLYTNFSGSIDIIMGVSEIIGIKLPENFNLPFFSKTITEFWRRWHITLGAWLKDYIFYPLQKSDFIQKLNKSLKNRFSKKFAKKASLYFSMLIMWILIGAWHGGEYKFIIGSGFIQFIYIFLEDILTPISNRINKKLGIKTDVFSYKLYQVIRTFLLFSFSMIFFRANSVTHAIGLIKNMFAFNIWVLFDRTSLFNAGLDRYDFEVLVISLVVLFAIQLLARKGSVREKLFNQNIVFRWTVLFILIFSIIIFGCYGPGYNSAEFIYGQF